MVDTTPGGRGTGRAWSGILLVLAVLITVFGGVLLTMMDARHAAPASPVAAAPATPAPTPTAMEIAVIATLPPPPRTSTPLPTRQPQPSAEPSTPQASIVPTTEGQCTPPADWVPYTVRAGDTVVSLAARGGTDVDAVLTANCLSTSILRPGDTIYLPSTPLPPPPRCSRPPLNWLLYTVQPGDTLYSLATARGVTVHEVVAANCMASTAIYVGKRLRLPPLLSAGSQPTSPGPFPPSTPTPVGPQLPALPSDVACSITSPANGSRVSGRVSFVGTATADHFLFFKLEAYGPATAGVWASLLGQVVSTPVVGGLLGTADFDAWTPGGYSVRLVVVDTTYNELAHCHLALIVASP